MYPPFKRRKINELEYLPYVYKHIYMYAYFFSIRGKLL